MKQATVGFRVHSGWSALVAVCLEKGAPVVLHRQRVQLVETFTYRFRQPYHTGERMALAEAREFIASVREKGRELAYRALRDLQVELEARGYQLTRGALLLASGRPLPELEKILASHALIHTADGELFRECLSHASGRCGLDVVSMRERELLEQASKRIARDATQSFAASHGVGAPLWRAVDAGRKVRDPGGVACGASLKEVHYQADHSGSCLTLL